MSAYFIVFVGKPHAPELINEYRKLALPTLKERNVKFHVRPGATIDALEGEVVDTVVMLEFPTLQEARDWYHSPGYQTAVKNRLAAANCHAVIVESP